MMLDARSFTNVTSLSSRLPTPANPMLVLGGEYRPWLRRLLPGRNKTGIDDQQNTSFFYKKVINRVGVIKKLVILGIKLSSGFLN